jgi:Fur family transcriptional regulator, ferric uptake regulator
MQKLLERVEERILASGGKRSRSRSAVIERFFRCGRHVSAEELTRLVKDSFPAIGSVTVYRTLKLLLKLGYANEVGFGEGVTRYESNLSSHHDHLVCRACGVVTEFIDPRIEELQTEVAKAHRFKPTMHRLDIYGYCRKCERKQRTAGPVL